MSPMRDGRTDVRTNKGRKCYSANGCWMAEFRNSSWFQFKTEAKKVRMVLDLSKGKDIRLHPDHNSQVPNISVILIFWYSEPDPNFVLNPDVDYDAYINPSLKGFSPAKAAPCVWEKWWVWTISGVYRHHNYHLHHHHPHAHHHNPDDHHYRLNHQGGVQTSRPWPRHSWGIWPRPLWLGNHCEWINIRGGWKRKKRVILKYENA